MRNKATKWTLICLTTVLCGFGISRLYFFATDDFRSGNIIYNLPARAEWDILPLTSSEKEQLDLILSQTFHYIDKGAQCYALESEDGNYILKLFKSKHLIPSKFLTLQPNTYHKIERIEKKKKNLTAVLTGYHLAYTLHKQQSGLIYLHLNPQLSLNKQITLVNKMGYKWSIDSDSVAFAIQKKGVKLQNIIKELLKEGKLDRAKLLFCQIFDLYLSEYQKGIYDRDHAVMRNFGFCNDQPIHFDVGMLSQNSAILNPDIYKSDLEKVTKRIKTWLRNEFPHYHDEILLEIENKLQNVSA